MTNMTAVILSARRYLEVQGLLNIRVLTYYLQLKYYLSLHPGIMKAGLMKPAHTMKMDIL